MKTKPEKFPINIRRGSSVVKIYREEKPSGTYFRVSFYKGAKRCGCNFADLGAAKLEAEAKAAQLSRGDLDALQVTGKDRMIYGRALEGVRPFNLPLDSAILEFAEAKKILGSFSLADAARFYMRHHGSGIRSKPVADAVKEMIAAKTENGLSVTYLADLRYRLGTLAETFNCDVNAITPDDLREFFFSLKLGPRGFNNTLATLRTFFVFAQNRGWLSKDSNLLAAIEKRKAKATPVEIFTPAEMAELMAHCSTELRPCFALAAFAGLRAEEILRLHWADVDRRPGFVEIAADKAKTAARRLVPVANNLARWLAICPRNAKQVWPHSKFKYFDVQRKTVEAINAARQQKSKKAEPFVWKSNAFRHSYISYRVAAVQDVASVALEAGNSPTMIHRHYRELCTPDAARTWFALAPEEAANIVPMEVAF